MSRLLFVSSHDLLRLLLCLRLTGVLLTSTPVGYSGGTSSDEDRPKWTRSVVNLKWSMSACICPSQVEAWFILLVWLTVPRYKREANCGSLGLPLHSSSEYDVTKLFMNLNCTLLDPYNLTFSSIEREKLCVWGLHTFSLLNKEDKVCGVCLL